jgi:hypothetical protein
MPRVSTGARKLIYTLLAAAPWVVWAAAIVVLRELARARKDPSLYTGTCYKPNGLAVRCSLDQWLLWDATPAIDIFTLVGAIAAAAITAYLWCRYRS